MRRAGLLVATGLRAALLAMLIHVLRAGPGDRRFAGKGIGPRALIVVPAAGLALPLLWLAGRPRRDGYPHAMDGLVLSIVALDLAGNVLDLYDRHRHFDLIPHAHGSGALTVAIAWLFHLPMRRAIVLATAGHALLEGQEIASDLIFGYRNVRGWWDTTGDLVAGLAGSAIYGAAYVRLVRDRGLEPASPLRS